MAVAAEGEAAAANGCTDDASRGKVAREDGQDSCDEDEGVGLQEHLKDSVSGSLRVKRLLQSHDDAFARKRRKGENGVPVGVCTRVNQLLQKWGLIDDAATRYVLERLNIAELKTVLETNYTPDKFSAWKSPAELCSKWLISLRERQFVPGGSHDTVSVFKARWKLSDEDQQLLRTLTHKELRYVFAEYDGTRAVQELVEESAKIEVEEGVAVDAAPAAAGCSAMGRFNRLEIIDPLGDALGLGDANLSFAIRLSKHRRALGHTGRLVATTFEPLEILKERYREIEDTVKTLESNFTEVWHSVDCTRLAVDPRFKGLENSFASVYYNFPHAGAVRGFYDNHPFVRWRHENLMQLFFRALRSFTKPGANVKVSSNMGAVGVRYSDIIGGAARNEFVHMETVPFLEWHLHRYKRSYGDRRDSVKRPEDGENYNNQSAESDMVYVFCYVPSGRKLGPAKFTNPPSRKDLMASNEGPLAELEGDARKNIVDELYRRFLSEVQGIHVG